MKKTVKRLIPAILSICLFLTMSVPVFAAAATKEDALETALKDAGMKKTEASRIKVKKDNNEYEISFKNKKNGNRYEYEVSVRTGKIREAEAEYKHAFNSSKKKVGKEKAIAAAAKKAGVKKSVVKSGTCRYKKEDGEWIYKLKFRTKKCKYEAEILAPTGKVIEFSREY